MNGIDLLDQREKSELESARVCSFGFPELRIGL